MNELIESLRRGTEQAIARGEEMKRQKEKDDAQKELFRHDLAKTWAEAKAQCLPEKAKQAASEGKNEVCVVASGKYGKSEFGVVEDDRSFTGVLKDWNTKGSGLKYYYLHKLLIEADFNVSVKYEYDGGGQWSWYSIYINW